ncbi:MAG TPA: EamA family transporter, partial [Planctomycetota bacterium]|nr:EamA family transporter [Planctomycetota bacterium]
MRDRLIVATLATVAGTLLFAGKGVLAKLAYARGVDATTLIGLRMGLALPVFIVLFWRAERAAPRPATWGETIATVALGMLGYHVASWLDFLGLERVDAAVERVVLYIYPTLVVIAAIARGRQAISARVIAALALTYAGIALTWGGQARVGGADGVGVALVAASAVAYAGFLIGAEGLMARLGSGRFIALAMCGS